MLTPSLAVAVVGGLLGRVGRRAGGAACCSPPSSRSCRRRASLAFDSLVQRDAPDANRGRSFARFELRFQIVWVVGAVIPVLITIPLTVGFLVIAAVAGFALFTYVAGQRAAAPRAATPTIPTAPPTATTVIDPDPTDRPPTGRPDLAGAEGERSTTPSPGR